MTASTIATRIVPAALLLLIAGCSDGTVDPAGNPKAPKPGSSYTRLTYNLDEHGDRIPGTDREDVLLVKGNDHTRLGRGGVTLIGPPGHDNGLPLIYESNGDLSVVFSGFEFRDHAFTLAAPDLWIRFPYGSKEDGLVQAYDTSLTTADGELVTFTNRRSVEYRGSEPLTIKGSAITHGKVTLVESWRIMIGPREITGEERITYWFAPEIGEFGRVESRLVSNLEPRTLGYRTELTDYTLK